MSGLAGTVGLAAALVCGAPPAAAQQTRVAQAEAPPTLLVLAAASLADVLPAVAGAWEAGGGGPVTFSFASSSRLAHQAAEGIHADVFVSADALWVDWLADRGGVANGTRTALAGNRLVVVEPLDGQLALTSPADLTEPGVQVLALADPNVPAGRYARAALESLGIWEPLEPRVVRGGSVRGALEWVARGEAQAAVVYGTDASAEPRVRAAFELPQGSHPPVRYEGAVLPGSTNPEAARAFLEFAGGPRAEPVWAEAGFRAPAEVERLGQPGAREPTGIPDAAPAPTGVPDPWSAIRISVLVALAATLAGLAPAVAAGWVLARREFWGKSAVATLFMAPLVLPPVVTGFLLLSLFGSRGVLGGSLSALGIQVPFTFIGAALAALVVGLPLYIMAVRNAFQSVDTRYEEVSMTLGVHRWATFRKVTLPLAAPGIAAGAVLAFARALGEFGATIVLAGNVEGRTQTIALAVYTMLETPGSQRVMWVLVGASVAIAMAAILGFEVLTRRQRQRVEDHRG